MKQISINDLQTALDFNCSEFKAINNLITKVSNMYINYISSYHIINCTDIDNNDLSAILEHLNLIKKHNLNYMNERNIK